MSVIFGHKKQIYSLLDQIKSNSLHHCSIFNGVNSIGKKLVAKKIARYYYCETKLEECSCNSCILINNNNHPDIFNIDAEEISTEEFKNLIQICYKKPHSSGRFIIIDNTEKLHNAIFNSLLKLLEEPPSNNYFILITNAIGKIPVTILSRSQKIVFQNLSEIELNNFILENNLVLSDELKKLSLDTPGKIIWAINNHTTLSELVINLENSNYNKVTEIVLANKEDLMPILEIVVTFSKKILHKKNLIQNISNLYRNHDALLYGYLNRNLNLKLILNIFFNQLDTMLKGNYILENDLLENWMNNG